MSVTSKGLQDREDTTHQPGSIPWFVCFPRVLPRFSTELPQAPLKSMSSKPSLTNPPFADCLRVPHVPFFFACILAVSRVLQHAWVDPHVLHIL